MCSAMMGVDLGASQRPMVASMPGGAPNPAPAARLADMVSAHGPVPAQSPLQPENVWLLAATAVSVTAVPCG